MKTIAANPMYRYLIVLTIASTVGLQAWRTLFNNFAVEVAGLNGAQVGVIQSVREIPGFLALLTVYFILLIKEHHLSALSVLCLGLGVAATGCLPTYGGLVFTTLIMSSGFHYYETTNQSLTLQYFDRYKSPLVFGSQRRCAAASNIAVGIFIYFSQPFFSYRQLYLLIGGLIGLLALWGFFQQPVDETLPPQRKKMVFRKRYWLFYFLTFMAGARRQIFIAFAVFLMVNNFHFSVREVAVLFLVNNLINFYLSPMIGRAIVRFGERKVLSLEYGSLILIFIGYALLQNRMAIAVLYILDHIFFNFAIAIRTYFQKIGAPRDIAPTMAVGFTINHISAVVLPAVGGLIWMIDYRLVFLAGALMSLVSLLASQMIRTAAPESTP
ncbi:MAG: MFS transporter [Deltaproteobacteria bacterium]|nr:MFS transporter [Candidatus Anaeroferrophillus wilburensis]MBN2888412.1 MFS transporter [Deltaproteobacteria bacterium]